jgi:hypothetical protein
VSHISRPKKNDLLFAFEHHSVYQSLGKRKFCPHTKKQFINKDNVEQVGYEISQQKLLSYLHREIVLLFRETCHFGGLDSGHVPNQIGQD